jgi:RNA polymerase sigma factor (sigma-70 family)
VLHQHKYDHLSDEEIIRLFKERSDNQFIGILYKRYGHLVLGLCLKYFHHKDQATETVLIIFSRLIADLQKHDVRFFKSWLYIYSKNHCLGELRKQQLALKRELELRETQGTVMDLRGEVDLNERENQILMMEKAILEIPDDQRKCICLYYYEKKSYHQISEMTGFSQMAVKSHIQNGKRNLKIKMEKLLNDQE